MLQSLFSIKKKMNLILMYDFLIINVSESFKIRNSKTPGKDKWIKKWEKNQKKITKIQQLFTPFTLPFPFLINLPS